MKLPRLSQLLPRRQEAPRRGDKFLLWALLAFLAAVLAGFLIFLPLAPLVDQQLQRVERQTGLQVQASPARLGLPPGVVFDRLEIVTANADYPPLVFEELKLQPVWGTLVGSNPGVTLVARLFGGDLQGSFRRDGEGDVRLSGAQLADLPLSPQLAMRLQFKGGDLDWQGQLPPTGEHTGKLSLQVAELQLSGLAALGAGRDLLRGGKLELTASSRGNTLQVESLNLSGGELEIAGNGTLVLGTTPASSRLSLRLTLRPTPELDSNLRDLLGLLSQPARDGSISLRLTGSLAAPQMR